MNNLTINQQTFFNLVKKECSQHGVTLVISNTKSIEFGNTGIYCNGYFIDQPIPTLAVATNKPVSEWFLVLIHEFSHMQQWLEKSPVWTNNRLDSGIDASDLIDAWLSHKIELTVDELNKIFEINIILESDCEIRALTLIDKFSLEINKIEYAQKANAYVLFYHLVKKYRKWYNVGKEPYSIESVWRKLPPHMNLNYLQIEPEYEALILECFK